MSIHGQKMWLAGACLVAATVATAADWPQFTGPHGDNTTVTPTLADAWPTGGPLLVWTTNVEDAVNGKTFRDVPGWFASPVVAGGRVFVIGRRYELSDDPASKQFQSTPDVLRCMNAADGKQLWQRDIPVRGAINPRHRQGEYFRSCWITPTVDGDRLYVRGSNGEVFCLNVKDGSVVWHWPEADADAAKLDQQGYWVAAPGVIAEGLFICNEIGGGNSRMIALDKLTGALRWRGKDTPDWGWSASGIVPMTLGGRTVLLTSDIAVNFVLVGEVVREGGVNLFEFKAVAADRNFLGRQPLLVEAGNGAHGNSRPGNPRGAAFDAGRAGDQAANFDRGRCVHRGNMPRLSGAVNLITAGRRQRLKDGG